VTAPTSIAAGVPHPDRRVTAHGWLRGLQRRSGLSRRARLVASVLFAYMDPDGSSCFPSLATIAADAGYGSVTSVLAGLDELAEAGWLLREPRRHRDGSPATTAYAAVVPAESVDPADPVGPSVDPAPVVDNRPPAVDEAPAGTPRPWGALPRPGGVDLASDLANKPPRTHARRRRRRGRPPSPAPSWRLVTAPDGRVYAVDCAESAESAESPTGSPLRSLPSLRSQVPNREGGAW
jgi:hypothetical protein